MYFTTKQFIKQEYKCISLTEWLPVFELLLLECGIFSISAATPCSMVSIVCCWESVLRKHCLRLDSESRNTPNSSGPDYRNKSSNSYYIMNGHWTNIRKISTIVRIL